MTVETKSVALICRTLGRYTDRFPARTPAVLFLLPCTVLAYLLLASTATVGNYALGQASAANGTLVIVGPYVSVCAAWEMETLRALWGKLTVRRSWWRVLAARLGAVAGCGLAITLLMYLAALTSLPSWAPPGWGFPALSILGVLAWTAFGAAFALVTRRLIALPAALLLPYLALTLPAGWEPVWLRHVNGMLFDCCGTSQVLDVRALVASAGFLGAVFVLALCVARVRLAPAQTAPWGSGLVALAVIAVAGATISQARGLGAVPVVARPSSAMVCRSNICLWPEDRAAYDANEVAWAKVEEAWRSLGLPDLPTVSIGSAPRAGILPVATSSSNVHEAQVSIAQSLPRALRGCSTNYADQSRNAKLDDLTYLLLTAMRAFDPQNPVVTVSTPAPTAAEAPTIWAQAGSCFQ